MPWLGPNLACDTEHRMMTVFYGDEDPSADAFARFLELTTSHDGAGELRFNDVDAVLIVSRGGLASVSQRQAIREVHMKPPPWPPIVLVTDSRVARAVMTAISWFLPVDCQTFPFAQLDAALHASCVDPIAMAHARALVHQWIGEYDASPRRSGAA